MGRFLHAQNTEPFGHAKKIVGKLPLGLPVCDHTGAPIISSEIQECPNFGAFDRLLEIPGRRCWRSRVGHFTEP
jgi:hypothetical protein